MTDKITQEKLHLLENYAKRCFDDIESCVTDFKELAQPQVQDDYDTLHRRLLRVAEIDLSLASVFEDVSGLRTMVDKLLLSARADLQDAETEAISKPQFKNPLSPYMSRPEVEAKLRSMTLSPLMEVRTWETLLADVKNLDDVLRSYQRQVSSARRDIDARLKILSMRY